MQHHLPRAPFFFEEMQKDINVALKKIWTILLALPKTLSADLSCA